MMFKRYYMAYNRVKLPFVLKMEAKSGEPVEVDIVIPLFETKEDMIRVHGANVEYATVDMPLPPPTKEPQ